MVKIRLNIKFFSNSELIVFLLIKNYSSVFSQIFFSFHRQKSSAVQAFYLWISLIFLIGRVLVLSLAAAEIHDESNRILPFIRNLPSSMWNIEIERFLEHLTGEKIALTGMNFFVLTRSLILKVCTIPYPFA